MTVIAIVLALLVAVALSGMISRMLPVPVPLPLVQIMLGALLAQVTDLGITLNPDVFFLLFLPPLLFLDGWRIPQEALIRNRRTIVAMASGLVVFTVLGLGWFTHWMIPAMPLAVAFALAAIMSPTDPVAVSAITSRVAVPKRLMHILEGESLLNDASGLVCMRFAVLAAMTGSFSLIEAAGSFLWVAAAGLACGVAITCAIVMVQDRLRSRFGEESGLGILVSLLIPFAAYLAAEQVGGSGILAAVSAGLTMSRFELSGHAEAVTRVRRGVVWDMLAFTLNGVMFVLLGEQLPDIVRDAAEAIAVTGHADPAWLVVYVLGITLVLLGLRALWVWLSLRFTLFRGRRHGGPRDIKDLAATAPTTTRDTASPAPRPGARLIAATTLAGVRGTVTLAGVLTLPLSLPDGQPFPARDLAIFLAAAVIILSLILAALGLPWLMRGLNRLPEPREMQVEDELRRIGATAAITAIEEVRLAATTASPAEGSAVQDASIDRLIETYRERLDEMGGLGPEGSSPDAAEGDEGPARARAARRADTLLRLTALRAERKAIYQAARSHRFPQEIVLTMVRDLDLYETKLLASL